jgi:hypothetical protein
MSKIKSFFQSIQKPFQGPINSIKNVAVEVHHEIIQKPFQDLSIQKPFQDPINSIKNVAVDVHHEIIQKPFQGLSNQDLSIQSIQKPFQGLSNSIKNVAVVHVHHDQKHPSDLLMHPRRLQADVPAEVAQKNVNDAYFKGFDMGAIDGLLFGSGTASLVGGVGWFDSALRRMELLEQYPEAVLLSQATSRAAAAAAATSGIEAVVIGSVTADAAGVLATGAASTAIVPAIVAVGAPIAVGVAEAAVAVAAVPIVPVVLSATLITAGFALMTASIAHYFSHRDDSMRAAGVHAVL